MALLKRRLIPALAALAATVFLGLSPAMAQKRLQLYEQEIKAGMLYNFLKYTVWPVSKGDAGTISVCIFGGDPFGGYLDNTRGRTVNQKKIAVRNIHSVDEAENCHLLFINSHKKDSWPEISSRLSGKSVLTVSDFDGFARAGGMIEFKRQDERIKVELNIRAVEKAQLSVHDRLLRLAKVVSSGAGR